MRKSVKLTNKIIAELEKHGNVLNACSKVGIGTSTYYRWCDTDDKFRVRGNDAIEIGRMNITDLAESKLIQNIQNGNQKAIEFQLRGNDRRYMPMNHKIMHDWKEDFIARNDISEQKQNLEDLVTGLTDMYEGDDLFKRLVLDLPTDNLMAKYPEHSDPHYAFTENEYIGKMLASEVMVNLLSDLKKRFGDKFPDEMGKMNYEDTGEDNPRNRRRRALDFINSVEDEEKLGNRFK
ncbi:MAG: hypothetical protein LBT19_02840 [Candidatus Nomurabacteria bacterium]|jgi:hypothetical protein|nr:hypothetical protein [Candidatus Nomurabacteria bacterium]